MALVTGTKRVRSAFALLDSTVLTTLSHIPAPAPPKTRGSLKAKSQGNPLALLQADTGLKMAI